jgi:hypothetical protein
MISTQQASYKRKVAKYIIDSLSDDKPNQHVQLDLDHQIATRHAIALQCAWRRRRAQLMVGALKQESNCKKHRISHPELSQDGVPSYSDCETCHFGDDVSEAHQKVHHQKYSEIERLLFQDQRRLVITDNGDNWNQRFQVF